MFIRTATVHGAANVVVAQGLNPAIGAFVPDGTLPAGQIVQRYTWTSSGGFAEWSGWREVEWWERYERAQRRMDRQMKEHWNIDPDGPLRVATTKWWLTGLLWNAYRRITAASPDPAVINQALVLAETTEGVSVHAWYAMHDPSQWGTGNPIRAVYTTDPTPRTGGLAPALPGLGTVPQGYAGWNPDRNP